jgi:hypothetical protein
MPYRWYCIQVPAVSMLIVMGIKRRELCRS